MKIGDLEIHLVSDGAVRVDPGGPFGLVPRVLYQEFFEPDEENTVPELLTCMLIRSRGKTILVDTGLGEKLTEKEIRRWRLSRSGGGLVEGLGRIGVGVDEVDVVINTHLHSDHCGGNTRWEGGQVVPTFPNATYLVQRMEWAEASFPDVRTRGTYFPENFVPLVASGQMALLHGDEPVTDQVRCVVTPGHTRAHQCVLVESEDWRALFVADMAGHAVLMMKTAWLTAFDVLPLENLVTKERWQRWALQTGGWLIFQHEPDRVVARLVEREGRLELEDVPEAQALTNELPTPERPPG